MKFKMTVKTDRTGEEFDEPYDRRELKTPEDVQTWAEATIMSFNDTLHPGDSPRTLIGVEVIGESAPLDTNTIWYCPDCGEMNLDDFAQTSVPMCGNCGSEFDWDDVIAAKRLVELQEATK